MLRSLVLLAALALPTALAQAPARALAPERSLRSEPSAPGGDAAPRAAGFVQGRGGALVYFDVERDRDVVLGEGVQGRPRLVMPYDAFVGVVSRAARAGALTPDSAETGGLPLVVAVDDRAVVRLATSLPAGQLALGLLALGLLGLVAGGALWERRSRRRQALRAAFRRRLAAARESERAHVARELHDGPVQALCAVQIALGDTAGGEAARGAVTDVVGELRALCDQLRPSSLDAFGLVGALTSLTDRAAWHRADGDAPLDVRFAADGPARALRLGAERELALYRIAQEALSNAVEHADAAHVEVALRLDGRRLRLSVTDDGSGPPAEDPLAYAAAGHYGLLGMQERADLLGARLGVGPAPAGRGTRVSVDLDLPPHLVPDLSAADG